MTMARNKEALFLTITEDVRSRHYLNVGSLLAGIGMECYVGKASSPKQFKKSLSENKVDYLILSGHGMECCFTDKDLLKMPWEDVALDICETNCLHKNAVVFMYCCQGGSKEVVDLLLDTCSKIKYVVGTPEDATPTEFMLVVNNLIYCLEVRKISIESAVKLVSQVIGKKFVVHSL